MLTQDSAQAAKSKIIDLQTSQCTLHESKTKAHKFTGCSIYITLLDNSIVWVCLCVRLLLCMFAHVNTVKMSVCMRWGMWEWWWRMHMFAAHQTSPGGMQSCISVHLFYFFSFFFCLQNLVCCWNWELPTNTIVLSMPMAWPKMITCMNTHHIHTHTHTHTHILTVTQVIMGQMLRPVRMGLAD